MKLVFSIFIFMCYKGKILPCVMLNTMIKRGASLVAQTVKNLPEMKETWVSPLGKESPLEEGMATHSSILAWRFPWTKEPVGYSPWGHKESGTTH